jgi:hypothetical protein
MDKSIEVFKTTVQDLNDAQSILMALKQKMKTEKINFDLDDFDNILRIEAEIIDLDIIEKIMNEFGHKAELLK